MAFLTLDLLIQVRLFLYFNMYSKLYILISQIYWETSRDDLPAKHPDIYLDYQRFLVELVDWMTERRGNNPTNVKSRSGNAMSIIKSSGKFPGVGVYTITEVFHRAGESLI
jgi:hypothetical protein